MSSGNILQALVHAVKPVQKGNQLQENFNFNDLPFMAGMFFGE